MLVNGKDLAKLLEEKERAFGCGVGRRWVMENLQQSFDKKEISPTDFSLRDLACHLIDGGHEMIDNWSRDRRAGGMVTEAVHSADTGAFSNITGQLFFNAIKEAMQLDELIGDQLVSTFESNIQGRELVPGISSAADEFETPLKEGKDYPLLGMAEEFIEIPAATKHGGILGITREALIADRTGILVERARGIGTGLAIRREKQILDVVIGAINPYSYKREARLTYGDGATAGQAMGFLNEGTAALVNYTDLQEVAELFYAMRDPGNGEPLGHTPTTIVCGKNLQWTARHIIRDTEVRLQEALVRAAGAVEIASTGSNRIPWDLTILSNEWVIQRLLAGTGAGGIAAADRDAANLYWFIGKPTAAFCWKQIWPLTVEEAPNNNQAQFNRDVWLQFKTSYKGVAGVREPRLMVRSDGTA